MAQIPLNLRPQRPQTFDNFHVGAENALVVSMLRARDRWTAPMLLLLGPVGSGKTHLGTAWAADGGGRFIDNADLLDDMTLFAAINQALAGQVSGLLLASHCPPSDWQVTMPDLQSRLSATPVLRLAEHDEATLSPILREMFTQAGRGVSADVVDFLLRNADRSIDALQALVDELDVAAGSAKVDVTKAFVAKYLRQRSEVDMFAVPRE